MAPTLALIGLLLLTTTVGFATASVLLLRRVGQSSSLMEGLVQLTFLPEKRRRFVWLLSLEGSLFLLSGLALGVVLVLGLPMEPGLALFVAFFVAGVTMMTALTLLGLRPSQLSQEEKEAFRRELPNLIPGLAFLPIHEPAEELDGSQELFVVSVPAVRRPIASGPSKFPRSRAGRGPSPDPARSARPAERDSDIP